MTEVKAILQNENFLFIPILLGTIIAAAVFDFGLRKYFKSRKDFAFDKSILKIIKKPLSFLIIITGIYFALGSLSVIDPYQNIIDKIFFILIVLAVSALVSGFTSYFIGHWLKVQKKYEKTPQLLNKIITVIVYVLALLVILSYFKIEMTPIVATLGLGSLAVGLALQSTLANFISGLHIISDRPFKVGDFVELEQNVSGYVEDIGWRSTKLRTLPNAIVIITNAKLAESTIKNISLPQKETAVFIDCGVSYDSDLEKVEKVVLDVANHIQKNVEGAIKSFEPKLRFHAFGDSNINFKVILRTEKFEDNYTVKSEFIKSLKKRFDEEKIEISWPVRIIRHENKVHKQNS